MSGKSSLTGREVEKTGGKRHRARFRVGRAAASGWLAGRRKLVRLGKGLKNTRTLQLLTVCAFALFWCGITIVRGAGEHNGPKVAAEAAEPYSLPFGPNPFAPGEVRTSSGTFIEADKFIPAAYCARCHTDAHEQWQQSAHRNSFREPFYEKNVNLFIKERGVEATRHCESCHNPVALVSGALTPNSKKPRYFDDEGVTCTVCHSIEKVTYLEGIGSYEIRPPALLLDENGQPMKGTVDERGRPVLGRQTDQLILSNVDAHRRAMMKDFYKTPEMCAVCHKAAMPREIEDYKWRRSFSVYDEWQMSSHSNQSPLPFYKKPVNTCQSCHMQPEAATTDVSQKKGKITSHRWAAANTAIPHFYGFKEQAKAVEEFLKADRVGLDIFTLKKGEAYPTQREATDLIQLRKGVAATGPQLTLGFTTPNVIDAPLYRGYEKPDTTVIAPIDKSAFSLSPGETVTVGVVISNPNVGHNFPTELRDFFEPWVEFKVEDEAGRAVYHSGFLGPDGQVDERAHIFQSVQVTESREKVRHHNIWSTRGRAYDNFIAAGRSELVRYQFRIPEEARGRLRVTARVLYRRFNRFYTDWVLGQSIDYPVIEMATKSVTLNLGENRPATTSLDEKDLVRFNNLGIALLDQLMFADARRAFEKTTEINPRYAYGYINQAIASFWRDFPEMHRLLDKALALEPGGARALYYKAALLRLSGKPAEALEIFKRVEARFPRDRMTLNQMALCYQAMGKHAEARAIFERVLEIDPDDITALFYSIQSLRLMGDDAGAERVNAIYLDKFEDWKINYLANDYLKGDEAARAEAVPWHVHSDVEIGAARTADPLYWTFRTVAPKKKQ